MLYIWPFFAFFSLPLLVPYALSALSPLQRLMLGKTSSKDSSSQTKSKAIPGTQNTQKGQPQEAPNPSKCLTLTASILSHRTIWPLYIVFTVLVSALVVKYNTIIHPFTLADNRHYMFYVFRYSIRRSQVIRLALILPYTISRWLVWGTLAGGRCSEETNQGRVESSLFVNHPLRIVAGPDDVRQTDVAKPQSNETAQKPLRADSLAASAEAISTSTAVVFLLATSLSLITAPLVEPRYFIIPWVMWRLLIPASRLHDHGGLVEVLERHGGRAMKPLLETLRGYDPRLLLETAWFVAINLVTMYIFLTKPYQWRAEDGSLLDDGRWQRFMW